MEVRNKICPSCNIVKPIESFRKTKHTKSGRQSWCATCTNLSSLASHHKRMLNDQNYREKRRERSLRNRYKYKYGITIEQKQTMLDSQFGRCEICNNEIVFSQAKVDHNHTTGAVRGILCNKCNSGLGYLESKDFIKKARKYIDKYET